MGIDFHYNFYVHRREIRRFLTAVADLCDPQESRWTSVVLPGGTTVRLPGTHGFTSGKAVELAGVDQSAESFDLSLRFPADEPGTHVVMGYIYLTAGDTFAILPDHWRFTFMPAVTEQSKMFLMSPPVRETFTTLALSTGASLCLLDNGSGGSEIIVTALAQRISTRVPGPCLLWRPRGHSAEAFEELESRLSGQPLDPPKWIIGPEHPEFPAEVESIAEYAQVPSHLWTGP